MEMFKNGVDQGYKSSPTWWSDPGDPDRYRYADPDNDYPVDYFPLAEMPVEVITAYCNHVPAFYTKATGGRKTLHNIVEFGSGGGWFTREFQSRGYSIHAYEGSNAGYNAALKRGVRKENIEWRDFRKVFRPSVPQAQIVLATEIGEHCEIVFAGSLVQNLVQHSDLIWWSSAIPGTNRPHLHHPLEVDYEFWIKLFAFWDFGAHRLPDSVFNECAGRGRYVFYNKYQYSL